VKTTHSSLVIVAVMLACAGAVVLAQAPAPPPQTLPLQACTITGTVLAGQAKLPGVAITVAPRAGGNVLLTSTGLDGAFRVHPDKPGEYDVVAELAAFASVTRLVTLGPDCQGKVELNTTLQSRMPAPAANAAPVAAPVAAQAAAPAIQAAAGAQGRAGQQGRQGAGQQGRQGAAGQQFQRVAPVAGRGTQTGQAGQTAAADTGAEDAAAVAQHLNLPAGFTADSVAQSVTTFGSNTQINEGFLFGGGRGEGRGPGGEGGFGGGPPGEGQLVLPGMPGMGGGFQSGAFGLSSGGGFGGDAGGGRGGGEGGGRGGGGRGGPGGGRPGMGNLQRSPYSGQASYTFSGSALNAAPYALNGQTPTQPTWTTSRYTAAVGGPVKIPGVFDLGTRSSFFLNYSGSTGSNLYDSYSTVPTLAERGGDFTGIGTVIDPQTGLPFANNQIPSGRVSPVATALMQYIPTPNLNGTGQNYHVSGTTVSQGNDINLRFTRTFGTPPARGGGRGGGMGGGGRGGGRGGPGAMMSNVVNVNLAVSFSQSKSSQMTSFNGIRGETKRTGWNVPLNVSFGKWNMMNTISVSFNSNKSRTTNLFGGVTNVAANAGIAGVSSDPFDWGVPTLSFSTLSGLHDVNPTESLNQTFAVTTSQMRSQGKHTMRWGADFRRQMTDSRSNSNARGSFTFTGLYASGGIANRTGLDFADFLLGLPQQSSLQYGPGMEKFRSTSISTYFQDDWRLSAKVTLNLGVRWEYQSPTSEATHRLVTLDVPPDFSAATSVQAGQTGPYYGTFPVTIVKPDFNNIAPRLGFAWRAGKRTTVRGGYSINYASVPYASIARNLAAQPPFATSNTVIGSVSTPTPIATVFATPPAANTTTNTFGVDPNYQIGYVHIWNLDVQHEIGRVVTVGVTYTGTRGASLDLLRAPNRGPNGLRISNVQAFTWESSGAKSTMNALSFRVRKRLSFGVSGGATYTYSKAMDNASSVSGGGGGFVAQDDQNLAAEWGRSNFDQRHQISGDFAIELPFGVGRKWVNTEGIWDKIVGGWMLNGNVSWGSGTPYTVRVIGASSDISRGTNGTLRADYNGQPIQLANPTLGVYFNTAAFSIPAAGTFGNSPRNLVTGPPNTTFNMSMSKSIRFATTRSFSIRIQANNVLNTPQWGSIDTNVNSPTFGRVTSMRSMRSVQIIARINF